MSSGTDLTGRRGVDDEAGDRLGRRHDRREVLDRVVGQVLHQMNRADVRSRGCGDQRVTVRRRARDHGGRNRAAGAAAVFHHDGLTERLPQLLGDQAGDEIDRRPGRNRHHDGDRFGRRPRLGRSLGCGAAAGHATNSAHSSPAIACETGIGAPPTQQLLQARQQPRHSGCQAVPDAASPPISAAPSPTSRCSTTRPAH